MKRVPLLLVIPLLVLLTACNTDPKAASRKYVDNGNKYFTRGKFKEASIMYRRALNKDARYGEAWYRLGLTDMQLNIPLEAARAFSRARELDPASTMCRILAARHPLRIVAGTLVISALTPRRAARATHRRSSGGLDVVRTGSVVGSTDFAST